MSKASGGMGLLGALVLVVGCSEQAEPPLAALTVTPQSGIVGELFMLDASQSASRVEPNTLRFRFAPDGEHWAEIGSQPQLEVRILSTGEIEAKVEVTDAEGNRSVAAAPLTLVPNVLPVISMVVTPTEGPRPLSVDVDLSGSSDPDHAGPLDARIDVDGDGAFDWEGKSDQPFVHQYDLQGDYNLIAEVQDSSAAVVSTWTKISVGPTLDLDVDANRDGQIDASDDPLEATFGPEGGAVLMVNLDDDDNNGFRDFSDNRSAANDRPDLAPLRVAAMPNLGSDEVWLSVTTRGAVRIFVENGGNLSSLLEPGQGQVALGSQNLDQDLALFVEATEPRHDGFDGLVEIALHRRQDAGKTFTDTVQMRVSPVLFPSNLEAAERVFIMPIDGDETENADVISSFLNNSPSGVALYEITPSPYFWDRWVQDTMQTGYQLMPSASGPHRVDSFLNTVRGFGGGEDLHDFVPEELTTGELGYVQPGGSETSLNYGGNIEVSAPYESASRKWPFGRILIGGGDGGTILGTNFSDHMTSDQRDFLDAQMQGPALELTSEWLAVGHIDEIFMLVPAPVRTERPWKVIFASPELALNSLDQLVVEGKGDAVLFSGKQFPEYDRRGNIIRWLSAERTVRALLAEADLRSYNQAVQARIDSVREVLSREMSLTAEDIIEVPVLYEIDSYYGNADLSIARNPGIQNLVVVQDTLFVPAPEGPVVSGVDVWEQYTRDALEPLGLTLHFVDVWYSYHILAGEIHCGTEIQHAPFETPWWEAEN